MFASRLVACSFSRRITPSQVHAIASAGSTQQWIMDEFEMSFYRCLEHANGTEADCAHSRSGRLQRDVASRLQQPFSMATAGILPAVPSPRNTRSPSARLVDEASAEVAVRHLDARVSLTNSWEGCLSVILGHSPINEIHACRWQLFGVQRPSAGAKSTARACTNQTGAGDESNHNLRSAAGRMLRGATVTSSTGARCCICVVIACLRDTSMS